MTTHTSQQTTPAPAPADRRHGSHQYVLTLAKTGGGMDTWYGTITPTEHDRRHDVFLALRKHIVMRDPAFAGAHVVFFSLEPNGL
ncbi:hypothetical protein [Streptomyces zhihengii]|uniref:Uncharacterized protein n=1 Tax=Streptomyces zhihengii TaxID=1818004 RepID=A0ABS2UUM7_9ACTN|nr:hypothetical protein [Streptomyces zhihengii]MBM9620577.1 hypothetical protein [Streptomyces zhihengii]